MRTTHTREIPCGMREHAAACGAAACVSRALRLAACPEREEKEEEEERVVHENYIPRLTCA